jgi:hypothetical protein
MNTLSMMSKVPTIQLSHILVNKIIKVTEVLV